MSDFRNGWPARARRCASQDDLTARPGQGRIAVLAGQPPRRALRWCHRARALALAWLAVPGVAGAAICDVPVAYATVQAAVNDPSCSEIVLAARSFPESATLGRSLILRGAGSTSTTLAGTLRVEGAGTAVDLRQLTIDATTLGAVEALTIAAEAEVAARDVVARNGDGGAAPLFADGFDSGDTGAWSAVAP